MTLIEVLIALGVVQVGVIGTVAVIGSLWSSGNFARGMGEASRLAQSQLEALDSLPGITLASPPNGTTAEAPMDGLGKASAAGPYTRLTTWSLTADGLRRHIDVTVSWADVRGKIHSATASRDRVP